MKLFALTVYLGVLAFSAMGPVASAEAQEDFYKSKRLTIIVGSGAGGGYDTYARVFARHYPNHIPGQPTIIVQNMPAAGGIAATGYIANSATRDGTVILLTSNSLTVQPLFEKTQFKFNPLTLNWIGSMGKLDSICVTWGKSPIKTLEQARQREVLASGGGASSNAVTVPNLLNVLVGTKFRTIAGYSSSGQRLAIERGETDALCGLAYSTLMTSNPDWILDKKVNILIQISRKKRAELGDTPGIYEFAKTDADRKLLDLWTIPQEMGRPFVAPPELPKERVTTLRRGFDATMQDPVFLEEAKKAHLVIDPMTGEEMSALIGAAYETPKEIVEKMVHIVQNASFTKKKE